MYKYYFDVEYCILYKSGYKGSYEEYIGNCLWNAVLYDPNLDELEEISEEDADDIIKEMDGDEYYLVDGEVMEED